MKFDNPRSNMLLFKGFDEEMNQIYEEQMDKIVYPFALEALTIPFFGSKVVTKTLEAISKPINKLISKFVNKSDEVVSNASKLKNPYGAKGKPDHQQKVNELRKKAIEDNPGMDITIEKKIQVEGSNRRPDVQVIDPKTKKTIKVYEAERNPTSLRNKTREAEYNRLGIPNETHKVGGK